MSTSTTQELSPEAGPEQRFFHALRTGIFQIQRCRACGRHVFYPRSNCPHCGSKQLSWVQPSGRGTVYSTTVVRRPAEEGGDHNVALIDLEEGPRMMATVVGVAPDQVAVGMEVTARIDEQGSRVVFSIAPPVHRR